MREYFMHVFECNAVIWNLKQSRRIKLRFFMHFMILSDSSIREGTHIRDSIS